MLLGIVLLLIGAAVFMLGVMLALTGPNGHPAGIPTIYGGIGLVLLGLIVVVYRAVT